MADLEKKEVAVEEAAKSKKEKSKKAAPKKNKIGLGQRIAKFFKDYKSELKKIVWPTWKQVLKNAGIVIVIVGVCAVAIGALDIAFRAGFDALVDLF